MPTLSRRQLMEGAAVAASGLLGVGTAAAADARFMLRCSTDMPASHPLNLRLQQAFDRIHQESGGDAVIQLFANGALGGETDTLALLGRGQLDFAAVPAQVLGMAVPVAAITSVAFAFSGYEHVWPALDGALGDHIRASIEAAGFTVCSRVWDDGFHQVTLRNKVINKLIDVKNLRIRVSNGPVALNMFRALGAAPAAMNFVDLQAALETHIFDAQENTLAVIDAAQIYKLNSFCSITNHMWDGFWMLGNGTGFAQLPVAIQDVITRNLNSAALSQRADMRRLDARLADVLTGRGMQFNTPIMKEFRALLSSADFYVTWKRRFGPVAWSLLEQTTGTLV